MGGRGQEGFSEEVTSSVKQVRPGRSPWKEQRMCRITFVHNFVRGFTARGVHVYCLVIFPLFIEVESNKGQKS